VAPPRGSHGLDEHAVAVAEQQQTITREQRDLIDERTTGFVISCFVLDELAALPISVRDQPVPTSDADEQIATWAAPNSSELHLYVNVRKSLQGQHMVEDVAVPVNGNGVHAAETLEGLVDTVTRPSAPRLHLLV